MTFINDLRPGSNRKYNFEVRNLLEANNIDVQDLDFVDKDGVERFDVLSKFADIDLYQKTPTYTHMVKNEDNEDVEVQVDIETAIEGNTSTINTLRTDFDAYSKTPTYTHTVKNGDNEDVEVQVDIETAIEGNTSTINTLRTDFDAYSKTPTYTHMVKNGDNEDVEVQVDIETAIEGNTTAIATNATAISNNATAIALKEDIASIKTMINMLAYGVQPSIIRLSNINTRAKFAKSIDQGTWDYLYLQNSYTSTSTFLTDIYTALAKLWEKNVRNVTDSFGNNGESGTNGDFTGGFLWKYNTVSYTLPADAGDYRLFFEDDYVCNKAGYLSLPQILRTGTLTYTRVSDRVFTITAQYPHNTI